MERIDQVLVVLQPVARNDLAGRRRRCCASSASSELAVVEPLEARRSAAAPASSRAGPGTRRPGRSAPRPDTTAGGTVPRRARAAVGLARLLEAMALARRTASRGSSSGCRAPRPCRSRATCRDARSAGRRRPARPLAVAKQDQVLAEHAHLARRVVGVAGERRPDASSGAAARPSACPAPTSVSTGSWTRGALAVGGAGVDLDRLPSVGGCCIGRFGAFIRR